MTRSAMVLVALACAACPRQVPPTAVPEARADRLQIPVEYHRLDNGLRVVLSPDDTAPVVTVAVYYQIGFRIEPKGRTGFAHLFEHMMFQGSQNLGKMEFVRLVQSNGGTFNGSTTFDFTNYFQIVPSNTLQTMLWAEADRMRGLAVTQENLENQQAVVKNEVRVNVLNRPYGGFPWLDLPQVANTNWYNAHNFYGDLEDLDAATLEEVRAFFRTYYSPNNAVLVVTGDLRSEEALAWIRQYFGDIPSTPQPPRPDVSEPRQEEERRHTRQDPLATRPALAIGYHMPERNSPAYWAMGLLHQVLLAGPDSRLYQALVRERGLTGDVHGGINLMGNMFNYDGPVLWTAFLFHDAEHPGEDLLAVIDEVIASVREAEVPAEELERVRVKARSDLYGEIERFAGFGRADLLASFALFDDDPARINRIEEQLLSVTPELMLQTAREYLRPTNRTVLAIEPKGDEAP